MHPPASPGFLAGMACLLESTARKPGNVHRFKDFDDTHYLDFSLSALAIAPALDLARTVGLGASVLAAVRATRTVVSTNTNLGMILLLAPLCSVRDEEPLTQGLDRVLGSTTVDDARLVYEAIRIAEPGGLGSAPEQDLDGQPTVNLRDAMCLAAARDSVALQYANGFADVLQTAAPVLSGWLAAGRPLETAVIATHLSLLAGLPDTLIARKLGRDEAVEASRRAAAVLEAGWPGRSEGARRLDEFDGWLRAEGHARNPGTTADLVAAALFVALREGVIRLPIDQVFWRGSA